MRFASERRYFNLVKKKDKLVTESEIKNEPHIKDNFYFKQSVPYSLWDNAEEMPRHQRPINIINYLYNILISSGTCTPISVRGSTGGSLGHCNNPTA